MIKSKMEIGFQKNQISKDSPNFQYDVRVFLIECCESCNHSRLIQVEFAPASDDKNDWDLDSMGSNSSSIVSGNPNQNSIDIKTSAVETSKPFVDVKSLPTLMSVTSPLATQNAAFWYILLLRS